MLVKRVRHFVGIVLILIPLLMSGRNAPVTTAGSSSLCPPGSVTIPLTVTNFTLITAMSLRLDYDPTQLSFVSYTNLHSSLAGAMVNDVGVSPTLRKILIVWTNITPLSLSNGSKMMDLNFTLTGGTTTLSFNNTAGGGGECEYADENGNAMNDLPTSAYYHDALITSLVTGAAGTITGQGSLCAGTTGVSYSVPPIANATSYTWSVPTGATIVSGGTTASIVVNFSNTATSGNITVFGTGPCGTGSPSSLNVTVIPRPVPAITGISAVCAATTGVIYTTEPGMTGYSWTITSGGVITSGSGTNTVTVTWNTPGSQNLTVTYTDNNGCTPVNPASKSIMVNARPVPTITGSSNVCAATTGVIYATEPGKTGYSWTITLGGVITSGWGTNTIVVTWNTSGLQNLTVTYTDNNGCTPINPASKSIMVNTRPVPTITGISTVCAATTGVIYTTEPGKTSYSWTITPGGVITSGSGTSTIIVTWNTPGSQNLTVTYTDNNGCTPVNPASKSIMVNARPVPAITGISAVCAATTGVIYTTEPGMTGYSWTITSGGVITYGSGTNTVTVTWNTSGSQNLTVTYTDNNGCTPVNPASKSIMVNARPVPTITGSNSLCAGSTAIPYSTEPGMNSYIWTISAGGVITSGTGTASVTVNWNTPGNQNLTVTYTSPTTGCAPLSPTVRPVTVKTTPIPTITGPATACENAPGNSYTTENGMSNYVWTVSPGGMITSGGGTADNSVTITWISPGAQTVGVNYINTEGCTALSASVFPVQVSPLPGAAGAVTGPAAVCQGATGIVYSTATTPNAITYLWNLPAGVTVTSGAGTNQITVNFGPTAISGQITVTGNNTCGNGISSPLFQVSVDLPPGPAGVITGKDTVCAAEAGVIYQVDPVQNATSYLWSLPPGTTITSGEGTNMITVTFANTPGSGIMEVNGFNGCGPGAVSPDFDVLIMPIPETPLVTADGPVLTSSAPAGNQWYYNGFIIEGATGQVYTVIHNTGYYWSVVTSDECPSEPSNKVWIEIIGMEHLTAPEFSIFPVPNNGSFTLKVVTGGNEPCSFSIVTLSGTEIFRLDNLTPSSEKVRHITLDRISGGLYLAILTTGDQKRVKKFPVFVR